jgi:DAPG hydrolase PhiG domain
MKYLGYQKPDFETPFSKFYNEIIKPIPDSVEEVLRQKSNEPTNFLTFENKTDLKIKGYFNVENGYTLPPDGSIHVAVLTDMPQVTPPMWDWWFGWHSNADNKYKLWHPKAHVSAVWEDGRDEIAYVGRTSIIEEYIGETLEKAAIQFKNPTELGFAQADIQDPNEVVYICARIGYVNIPLDFGWLIHQVRKTKNGAEMRSRFWLGGPHIAIRGHTFVGNAISKIIQKLKKLPEQQAIDLLTHCSEEMNHLAAFLPEIYRENT